MTSHDETWICPQHPFGHRWDAGLICSLCGTERSAADALMGGLSSARGWSREAAESVVTAHRAQTLAEELVATPSEWDCAHGTADDEPFCQELGEDEHPTCPTIRVHRDDAAQFAAMVDMVNELRSRLVATELLVERARDKGNDQISTDALVDALGLDQGEVR